MRIGKQLMVLALCLGAATSGCSKSQDDNSNGDPTPAEVRQLVHSDLSGFLTADTSGATAADQGRLNGALTAVFGGTSGQDFYKFYEDRIHAEVYSDDDVQVVDNPPVANPHTSWEKDAIGNGSVVHADGNDSKVETVALNVGFALWFQSLLDSTTTTVILNGNPVPIGLPHPGIMLLDTGYRPTIKDTRGNTITLPAAYRQGILLHEARHADCTGGLTQADLEVARTAQDIEHFDENFKKRSCGHMHVRCETGTYQGLYACDAEPWGAYVVGGLYMVGMIPGATADDVDTLKALAVDSLSRVEGYDFQATINGQYGQPDMSSEGVSNP